MASNYEIRMMLSKVVAILIQMSLNKTEDPLLPTPGINAPTLILLHKVSYDYGSCHHNIKFPIECNSSDIIKICKFTTQIFII